jgi:hypothetical protein
MNTDIIANQRIQVLADSKQFTIEQLGAIRDQLLIAIEHGYGVGRIYNPRFKQVVEINEYGKIMETFDSAAQAGKVYGIAQQNISAICLGKEATAKGRRFRFKNMEDYK